MSNFVDSDSSIERCPHDEEHPYTHVLNALIRDKSISPNCRMIIIFLLSNKNNWKIRIPHLINEFKGHIGKELMYKLINEAIESGYMKREEYIENNLKRYKYFLSEKPKFKKFLRHPDLPDAGGLDPDRQHCKERTSKERTIDCSESPPPDAAKTFVIKKISLKRFEGPNLELSHDDLLTLIVQNRKDWNSSEIEQLWKILENFGNPVRDLMKFCQTTIENLRKSNISKEIKEKNEKCIQKTYNKTTSKNTQNTSNPSSNTNETTSKAATSERPLANWKEMLGWDKKFPDLCKTP